MNARAAQIPQRKCAISASARKIMLIIDVSSAQAASPTTFARIRMWSLLSSLSSRLLLTNWSDLGGFLLKGLSSLSQSSWARSLGVRFPDNPREKFKKSPQRNPEASAAKISLKDKSVKLWIEEKRAGRTKKKSGNRLTTFLGGRYADQSPCRTIDMKWKVATFLIS
jgi:hypothetical protein